MPWMLIEGLLSPEEGCAIAEQMRNAHPASFKSTVLPSGRISEIAFLDMSCIDIRNARFNVRPIGWFERTFRMARRVLGCFLRVPRRHRLSFGVSFSKALLDLPYAYCLATELRIPWNYTKWLDVFDNFGEDDCVAIGNHIANMNSQPRFFILLMDDKTASAECTSTINSLNKQLYRNFTCAVLNAESEVESIVVKGDYDQTSIDSLTTCLQDINEELGGPRADDWLLLLHPGDHLPPYALYWFACEITAMPEAAAFYADDGIMDEAGIRSAPRFKPSWSLTHFRATDFVGNALVLRGKEVFKAGGVDINALRYGPYELLLNMVDILGNDGLGALKHVPALLLHRSPCEYENEAKDVWQEAAVQRHLQRKGIQAEPVTICPGIRRLRYTLPMTVPLVSIIIPTRDALTLTRQCVESLLEKTVYPRFEILVVDNQSSDPDALAYLAYLETRQINETKIRVLRYNQPFNYSAINNFAVREAHGEVLCLLNNDTEVISPDWLNEMVGHLLQPCTGVVGAKLYYPDRHVQHAGIVVGPGGCADHLHMMIPHTSTGYCNRAIVAQELSAVTAACMVTWRDLYLRLRGLNEKQLPIAFSDVDYCLKVREAGHKVVWSPHAELYHYESVSRAKDKSLRRKLQAKLEIRYMCGRWKQEMQNDPYYNPNLSYDRSDFSLSQLPRVRKPWK
jgi:GT2 family glycosyltransferase